MDPSVPDLDFIWHHWSNKRKDCFHNFYSFNQGTLSIWDEAGPDAGTCVVTLQQRQSPEKSGKHLPRLNGRWPGISYELQMQGPSTHSLICELRHLPPRKTFKRICKLMFTNCFHILGLKRAHQREVACWNLDAIQKSSPASLIVCFQHLFNLLLLSRNLRAFWGSLCQRKWRKCTLILSCFAKASGWQECVFYN